MKSINNTGDYLEALKSLLEARFKNRADVLCPSDIEEHDAQRPQLVIEGIDILDAGYSDDGRQQNDLGVDILIRVPTNIGGPEVVALNIAGSVCSLMNEQYFGFPPENEQVDAPEDICGQPLGWDKKHAGYGVSYSQKARYGLPDGDEPFNVVGSQVAEENPTLA